MNSLVLVIFFSFGFAVDAAPRIVGGRDAPDGKYPYQVSIRAPSSHTCGGSILTARWILTAAHCIVGSSAKNLKIHVGSNKLKGNESVVYQAEYITYHEKFSGSLLINDIGLIRVDRDIEFNQKVQQVKLAKDDIAKADYPVVLSGWGRLTANGKIPNNLQEIDLKVIDQENCSKKLVFPIKSSHVCTLTKAGEGACNGDSGGPLVSSDGFQIGIVLFGQPCARGKPDVYTRVYAFLDWIDAKISEQ